MSDSDSVSHCDAESLADPGRRRASKALLATLSLPGTWLMACTSTGGRSARQVADRAATSPVEAAPSAQAAAASLGPADHRLVNRLTWGACDHELARVQAMGRAAYLRAQLAPDLSVPLPEPAQAMVQALSISQRALPDLLQDLATQREEAERLSDDTARQAARQALQRELGRLGHEAASRHLMRALYSPHQLLEHMTWFWFNHFNVFQHKQVVRAMVGDYEERAIRPHALGRFRDLLGQVTRHPAMLRYLDNDQNAVNRPNENHARELLELHTLGVDAGYTQRDVQELARVLTGHGQAHPGPPPRLRREWAGLWLRDGAYEFHPARHDFGDKQVLGVQIKGRGAAELDQVLDLLARHPATARRVCTKVAVYLLADQPPADLVDAMVQAYQRSSGHMGEVLGVLLRAPAFTQAEPGKFKDPMHYVVSAVRAAYDDKVILNPRPMVNWLNRMGQGLYNRQTPDGYPMDAAAWSSAGQMAVRFEVARALGASGAGLFRPEGEAQPAGRPAFPQLARPTYYQFVRPSLHADTRQALDAATSAQEWNTLYLSSPEFMYR